MKKVPIATASAGQLATFAATNYGLEASAKMGADKIRALLSTAGFNGTHIEVEEDPAPATPKAAADGKPERKFVTVIIATQEGPGGSDPVPVGVNGRVMLVPRATPQRIPYEYYEVLMHAVKKVYDPKPDGGTMPPREVPTFPVMRVPDLPGVAA